MHDRSFLSEMVKVGEIGVDAGLCWIGDPCYILHKEPNEIDDLHKSIGKNWSDFCDMVGRNHTQFNYSMGHPGLGVCVSTGDGTYPVYANIKNGRVMSVFIDFEGEEEEIEEETEEMEAENNDQNDD